MSDITPREGEYAIKLLLSRNGSESIVTLSNGAVRRVLNIAPGRGLGEQFDHISTNIAPPQEGRESHYASDVREIATEDEIVLFRSTATQNSN